MPALPTKLTGTTNETLKAIIKSNPLYKHRTAQRPVWSLRTAAIYLGVSPQTINNWESGATYPADENLGAVASKLGKTFEQLSAEWQRWWSRKNNSV